MQVLCSTGVFSRTSDPLSHKAILRHAPALDADGLEIIFYPRWYADTESIADELSACALPFPVLHAEKSIGEALGATDDFWQEQALGRLACNCDFARRLGVKLVVLHLWGMPESDRDLERNLRLLPTLLSLVEAHGLTLAIETIPCTFGDPLTNIRRAIKHDPRARVALDTEFLAQHDQLDAAFDADWLWQSPLVRHAHLKDHSGRLTSEDVQQYLHPGEGGIDFRRFVRRLRATGYDSALSLEARAIDADGEVDIARIQSSLRFIRELAAET